ncbi:MAG: cell division protein FtsX [Cytophagaceae bacterium]|nr:cell division protein FtsX [Cytophagaceae bacterium]
MIRNYIKTAWRNIWKNKLFSAINIISLAIGFSASFVIGLMVYYDLSFDTFHEDADRIYRITTHFTTPQGEFNNRGVSIPLMQVAKEDLPGVGVATGFFTSSLQKAENPENGKTYKHLDDMVFTDPEYFKVFRYDWLAGSPDNALNLPNQLVLTENKAALYFPGESPSAIVGKTMVYNDSLSFNVTGVVANLEGRTDLIFNEFISQKSAINLDLGINLKNPNWEGTNSNSQLFIKVAENASIATIQKQLDKIALDNESSFDKQYNNKRTFRLQPFGEMHFDPELGIFNNSPAVTNKPVMIGLGFVALFLLLLACINFINLNTAQADQRAREIGIRKTLGSSKGQLIFQFLGETFLLTLFSAIISVVLAYWLLNEFREFVPKGLGFSVFGESQVILIAIALVLLITVFAGIYPAMVLTRFKPVSILKGQTLNSTGKPTLRRVLTVFQFTIAQVFIIGTLLVGQQIKHLMSKDMGFKTDAIAYMNTPFRNNTFDKTDRLAREMTKIPGISKVALGGNPPASNSVWSDMFTYYDEGREIQTPVEILIASNDFMDLYGLHFLAGRKPLNDTIHEIVINEAYLHALGFKDAAKIIDKTVKDGEEEVAIVGVVKDFNQRSAKTSINPMMLRGDWDRKNWSSFSTIHLNISGIQDGQLTSVIPKIEQRWKDVYPDNDFEIKFLDETIANFYRSEKSLSKLLQWAMGLSVLISCLGLLGLVIYTTNRRTKEIGIRKVLGASLAELNVLLCKDFLLLVCIAFVIAAPIAAWLLNDWLQDFAYRTGLSWWVFALSGTGMIVLALIIMSIRTMATAMKNPVKSLRTE